MKGIILAGGKGTRLYPATEVLSKQLIPVYDKPMVYYPFSILMLANITEVLIISDDKNIEKYKQLFGTGKRLGMSVSYAIQHQPNGIGEAFLIAQDFIGNDDVCLILGDNILFGWQLPEILIEAKRRISEDKKSLIFGYMIKDPKSFGVAELNKDLEVISLEEKPDNPKSNWATIGLYMYDASVVEVAKSIEPSPRGELEITDINKKYLEDKSLGIELLGRGCTWFDAGNCDDYHEASSFVRTIENRQGYKIACLEEIAYNKGLIDKNKLSQFAKEKQNSKYGQYLLSLLEKNY